MYVLDMSLSCRYDIYGDCKTMADKQCMESQPLATEEELRHRGLRILARIIAQRLRPESYASKILDHKNTGDNNSTSPAVRNHKDD